MTKKTVQVREDGDTQAARIDRIISTLRSQESSMFINCKGVYDINASTSATTAYLTYATVVATDEFQSVAQQYNMYKVKGMRFEVFHTNPTTATPVALSTFHMNMVGVPPASYLSEGAIVDAPDAMFMEPGSKKQTFYWNASGQSENEYQDTTNYNDHGGLRFAVRAGTTGQIGIVVMSALVVFRGRR